ncbi:MAG: leucine-rich repeat domain-containing protein [Clostridia bacterium]|nr:leucine-rich repeat domain-containing protein [Clostridia bacterium]
MKRFLLTILIVLLSLSTVFCFTACGGDDDETTTEKPKGSEGLRYQAATYGIGYYVTGLGSCTDTEIIIPSEYNGAPVVGISYGAFESCAHLTSITLPDTLVTIGEKAFKGCSGITSITIPDTVTEIGKYAFHGCSNLSDVTFENTEGWYLVGSSSISVTSTGSNALNLANNHYNLVWKRDA